MPLEILESIIPVELTAGTMEAKKTLGDVVVSHLAGLSEKKLRLCQQNSKIYMVTPVFKQGERYISYRHHESFMYDALTNEVTDIQPFEVPSDIEAAQSTLNEFIATLSEATGETDGSTTFIAADTHDDRNKIYGSLRLTIQNSVGTLTIQTHISEDGNIQMSVSKEFQAAGAFADQVAAIKKIVHETVAALIDEAENDEKNNTKSVRRKLPICGQKVNWAYQ